jgi:hypothetical protein
MFNRSTVCNVATVAAGLWLLACLPAAAQDVQDAQDAQDAVTEVPAIWKSQEITFYFQSYTTFYSCSSLERKVERVMEALGAKARVRVRSADCPGSVARMPRVIMEVTSPVEATPEALAEREKGKSTRELSARVQGKDPQEGMEQFPAKWQRVSLAKQLNLEPGDCELVEEIRRKVLPKLAVKVTGANLQCSPHQLTLGRPKLEVDALVEMPKPDSTAPVESTDSTQKGTYGA